MMGNHSLIEQAAAKLPKNKENKNNNSNSNSGDSQSAPFAPDRQRLRQSSERVARISRSRLQKNNIISPNDRRSRTVEEFRLIKRSLLTRYAMNEGPCQNVVLVTSSVENEGKTFNALNLAMSVALEQDYRVLLVDADMTNPSIMRTLGIEAEKGLIDVLSDHRLDLSDVLIRTDIDGLTLLPPGSPHALSTELLASKKMASLVAEIAGRYEDRFIIFDAPPVLVTSETPALAHHAGQVVFVIKSDTTPRALVKEALNLIADCSNISLVLNGTSDVFGKAQFAAHYERYQKKGQSVS